MTKALVTGASTGLGRELAGPFAADGIDLVVVSSERSKAAFFFIQQVGKQLPDGGKLVTLVTSLLAADTGLYSIYAGSKSPVEHFHSGSRQGVRGARHFGGGGGARADGDAVLLRSPMAVTPRAERQRFLIR